MAARVDGAVESAEATGSAAMGAGGVKATELPTASWDRSMSTGAVTSAGASPAEISCKATAEGEAEASSKGAEAAPA